MSNIEAAPAELECGSAADDRVRGQLIEPREVPLGGPRGMQVRRTLPRRARSLIGAWCFVDHYGPEDVAATGGMRVAGHPHTGLQTVSWLFSGEIEHRDTTGAHARVRPGEVNLMTAGAGIAHSEYSTADTTVVHGVQLWVALPERSRFTAPGFEHFAPPVVEHEGARALVFIGSLLGCTAPVRTHTPLLGAEITLPAEREVRIEVDPAFEHGVLVDTGAVAASGVEATAGGLVYQPPGAGELSLRSADGARVLLLGGPPLGEQIVMWWNFVGRSHEEIVEFRGQWQAERDGAGTGRFGPFPQQWAQTLPAPALPNARLRRRG